MTTTTILGHGQKKTTLTGIILNKGNPKRTLTLALTLTTTLTLTPAPTLNP